MLKNLKIGMKLNLNSGSILLLLIVVGAWAGLGLSQVVEDGHEVAEGNRLTSEILQREVDHLNWAKNVSNFLLSSDSNKQLGVEVDHTKCGFGKWYYGDGRKEAEHTVPALADTLRDIEEPHKQLHQSAVKIKELSLQGDKTQANLIFTTQTQARLKDVQGLLREVVETSKSSILNDKEMIEKASKTRLAIIMLCSIAIVMGLGSSLLISKSITAPLANSMTVLDELSKGIFTSRLRMNRKDEIGQLAASLDHMAETLARQVEVAKTIAGGDLTVKIELSSPQDTLGQALQTMQQGLAVTITQTKLAGNEIANGSLQIADSSQSLAQGASEQASSLEEISSAMTEMSSQTKMTADNAHKAQELSNAASSAAEDGNRQMQLMVESMEEIRVASQSVANVIKVIEEIAFQTNMLALNAAVEAAHAGQHGKGFAVVAEEVRNLAARSAKAAKETADLIAGSVAKTENGAKIADQTAASLVEITNRVAQTSELVRGIAEAAREQSQGIDQVSQGLHQIDQVTQQNSANAEQGAAASEQLSGQASQLNQLMQAFKVDSGNTVINPGHRSQASKPAGGMRRPIKQLGMAPKATRPSHDTTADPSKIIPLDDSEFGKY